MTINDISATLVVIKIELTELFVVVLGEAQLSQSLASLDLDRQS